jgi:hypothetical protein
MSGVITSALLAAAPTKSANGGLGLVVVFVIALVLFVLLRSMARHLRKVDKMKSEGVFDTTPSAPTAAPVTASDLRKSDDQL